MMPVLSLGDFLIVAVLTVIVKYKVKQLCNEGRFCEQSEKMIIKKTGTSLCFQPPEGASLENTVTLVFWHPE